MDYGLDSSLVFIKFCVLPNPPTSTKDKVFVFKEFTPKYLGLEGIVSITLKGFRSKPKCTRVRCRDNKEAKKAKQKRSGESR